MCVYAFAFSVVELMNEVVASFCWLSRFSLHLRISGNEEKNLR